MALIFNEQFEATGYDETSAGAGGNWIEVNAGGGTLDPDYPTSSVTGAPARWGSQCLKIIPGSSVTTTENVLDAAITGNFYCRTDVIFGSMTTNDYNNFILIYGQSGNIAITWRHQNTGGNNYIYALIDEAGSYPSAPGYQVSLNTVYRLDSFYNPTTDAWEVKINGESQGSGSGGTRTSITSVKCYSYGGYPNDIVYFDNVQIATDGWVPDDVIEYTSPFPAFRRA